MLKQTAKSERTGSATVELIDGDIIYCKLKGDITESIARGAMDQTKTYVLRLQQDHKPTLLLIDISEVTSQDSGARSAAKEIHDFNLDRIAVSGGNRLLKSIGQYILRSGDMAKYSRIFSTRMQATRWLRSTHVSSRTGVKYQLFWVSTLLGALISAAGVISWIIGKPILITVAGVHRGINPIAAIAFILIAVAAIIIWAGVKKKWQRIFLRTAGIWSILLGTSAIIRYALGTDPRADTLLFSSQVETGVQSARISPIGAVLCVSLGLLLLLVWQKQISNWQKSILYFASIVTLFVPIIVMVGYSFAFQSLYSPNGSLPVTIPTVLSVLLIGIGLLSLNAAKRPGNRMMRITLSHYWQGILVFLAVVMLTGLAWQQSTNDLRKAKEQIISDEFRDTTSIIGDRIQAYSDALRGYKGFFASSAQVDPTEYSNYFLNADLRNRYPGITAVTFVRAIPKSQEQAFINETKKLYSSNAPYKNYKIYAESSTPESFPLLFVAPDSGLASLGFNLASDAERLHTLRQARDTGQLTATGLINLNASRPGSPKINGFFISMPVYKQEGGKDPSNVEDRRTAIFGMVNAIVNDDRLFSTILEDTDKNNLRYVIYQGSDNRKVFETSKEHPDHVEAAHQTVRILNQRWDIKLYAPEHYGVAPSQRLVPYALLAGGLILAIMAAVLIVSQARRREQALNLASRMTEDLQTERNAAVTLQQKDEAILSSIGDAVFAIDKKGIITLFNPAAQAASGFSAQEAIGRRYDEVLNFQYEATGKVNDAFIKEALQGKITSMKDHTIVIRKDGSRIPVADSAAPIRNNEGVLQGVIVVFRDITKEYELDKAKTEFVSLASHQLRTPLSAINWYAELLISGDAGKLSKDAKEYAKEIYEGNQRMIELVNSLLDVSRLELGKLTNNPEPTDVVGLVNDLEKELTTSIKTKDITFETSLAKKLPTVNADPKLLRMVVQNLLSNAVKYTPSHGKVTALVRNATADDKAKGNIHAAGDMLFMQVTDTGYGIPKAQQAKIFSKLFRADNVRALDVEGTGLGLYIVKEVINNLQGQVWFESIESVGTTFYVLIPYNTSRKKSVNKGAK